MFRQREWHGHEMIFGFGGAMCGGFLLTALPSWAKTAEVVGRDLRILIAAWCLGRGAMLLSPFLPPIVTATADLLYFPLLTLYIAPCVWLAGDRYYRWALAILGAFCCGNLIFHYAIVGGDEQKMRLGVMIGYYSLMVLYSIIAGLLTHIFTTTWLAEKNLGTTIPVCPAIEWLAAISIVVLGIADLTDMPILPISVIASLAVLFHCIRMRRWLSVHVIKSALLLPMHLGYVFLILSFVLRVISEMTSLGNLSSSIHAFTIGAWGLTKLSLMTRVSLKHTGRPLIVPGSMKLAFVSIGLAAVVRVGASFDHRPAILLPLAAVLWVIPFAIYLSGYAFILWRPSIGRTVGGAAAEGRLSA